jgi:hypothetical protein
MNLKENYERLFGKMPTENKLGQRITPKQPSLTENQQNKFFQLQKAFQQQYPSKQLRLKEGYILVDNLIVERAETLLNKNNNQIITTLKSFTKKCL